MKPLALHAQLHQKQRLKNLDIFSNSNNGFRIATDVAARGETAREEILIKSDCGWFAGLDIPDVEHVVHYHVPRTSESYVHRSGRTARATKQGFSLLLAGKRSMQAKLAGPQTETLFDLDWTSTGERSDALYTYYLSLGEN